MQKKVLISLLGSALVVFGCDSDSDGTTGATGTATTPTDDDGGSSGDVDPSGNPTEDTMDSNSTDPTSEPETDTADPTETGDSDTEDTTETGIGFITDPDGGGVSIECSVWDQDCGDGEKCAPWANDGGSAWNATKCVPVDAAPAQVGETCTVEGSGVSGVDTCDVSSMCWNVDGETNEGTCVAFCTGSENAPVCDDPTTSCSIANEGVLILCLPSCDPLSQDCSDGEACYPIDNAFVCAPDASGEDQGVDNDPCEFINACDPGLACLNADAVEGCTAGSTACCNPFCDLSLDPSEQGCSGSEVCEAAFEEGNVPPGYEDVGYCVLPA